MSDWPLIDDEEPLMRLAGFVALATGMYWFIAPLLVLSELFGELFEDVFGQLFPCETEDETPRECQETAGGTPETPTEEAS